MAEVVAILPATSGTETFTVMELAPLIYPAERSAGVALIVQALDETVVV